MTEYLAIAEITKPQGVHGELKLRPITSDPDRFYDLTTAYLEDKGVYTPVKVKFIRQDADAVFMHFDGINDRNAAETLRGRFLYVDRAHAIELTEDETFIVDLIGLKGVDTEGNELGELIDVMQPGGNDVYVFRNVKKRQETLVPALKSVVVKTDLENGVMLLDAKRLSETAVTDEI